MADPATVVLTLRYGQWGCAARFPANATVADLLQQEGRPDAGRWTPRHFAWLYGAVERLDPAIALSQVGSTVFMVPGGCRPEWGAEGSVRIVSQS